MIQNIRKPTLAQGLALAGVAYLLGEFVFNAALIHAVSAYDAGHLEQIARLLAGIGLALLLVRLRPSHSRAWVIGLIIAGLVMGYVGQKIALDSLMNTVSHSEQMSAPDVAVLEKALLSGAVGLDGLNPDIKQDSESYATFIAMLGVTAWHNDQMLAIIQNQKGKIVQQLALIDLKSRIGARYAGYQDAIDRARQAYAAERDKAATQEKRITRAAGQYDGILNWFLQHRNNCQSDACRDRYDAEYDKRVEKALGLKIPWQAFCDNRGTRRVFTTANGQIKTEEVNAGWDCSGVDPATIVARLKKALAKRNEDMPGSFADFLASDAVQNRLRAAHPELKSLQIAPGWSRQEFANHLVAAIHDAKGSTRALSDAERERAARAVLVPPVAIAFSLSFVLLNILSYLNDALRRFTPWPARYRGAGLAGLIVLFAVFAPSNGVIGGANGWLVDVAIHYENLIYPIGNAILGLF